jgi:hypothetical protein
MCVEVFIAEGFRASRDVPFILVALVVTISHSYYPAELQKVSNFCHSIYCRSKCVIDTEYCVIDVIFV